MKVVSYNIDTHSAYVYDLYADADPDSVGYMPFQPSHSSHPCSNGPLYVDVASFPSRRLEKYGITDYHPFCSLDEYFFFRTILQSEARRPTLIPREEYWRAKFTWSEFVEAFSRTYKIIYYRWRDMDPEGIAMRVMFHVKDSKEDTNDTKDTNDTNDTKTFREWMNQVE